MFKQRTTVEHDAARELGAEGVESVCTAWTAKCDRPGYVKGIRHDISLLPTGFEV
jgi:hypothetical protein